MAVKVEGNGTPVESIKDHEDQPNGHVVAAPPTRRKGTAKPRKSILSIAARSVDTLS
jgi:hypothetical protein